MTDVVPGFAVKEGVRNLEVVDVFYDLHMLTVVARLHLADGAVGPLEDEDNVVHVVFTDSTGFRVLDEGQLVNLVGCTNRASAIGLVYEITDGGWRDSDETLRTPVEVPEWSREFFVVGIDDCVSVLACSPPTLVPATCRWLG